VVLNEEDVGLFCLKIAISETLWCYEIWVSG